MPERVVNGDDLTPRVSSGVTGFDDVLGGGFPANRVHLIQGAPGTGKTTVGLQFLLEGARRGESVLYVTLSESIDELQTTARSHGWSLDGVLIRELAPGEDSLKPDEQYTILHPAEVELGELTWSVLDDVDRHRPTRVVFDSLAELQLLARDRLRFRRQVLALKQFFGGRNCTVLLLDGTSEGESGLESVAHSVIELESVAAVYGGDRRRLRVAKMRGARYRAGHHDFIIETGGLRIFPRLVAAEHHEAFTMETVPSGLAGLDTLLGGGLTRGTSTLLIGPAGAGKSILASQYLVAAADRSEPAVVYVFDEGVNTLLARSDGLGIDLRRHVDSERVLVKPLDPGQLSPGQFDYLVRDAVETRGARVVVLDSLNGYLNAMPEERTVLIQLHELLSYLGQRGVVTVLTVAQHGLVGDHARSPLDVSYLADTVILLRFFEAAGELRRAISVVKKRSGAHEPTIRELRFGPGIRLGPPLQDFQGVLSGSPAYVGAVRSLLPEPPPPRQIGEGHGDER